MTELTPEPYSTGGENQKINKNRCHERKLSKILFILHTQFYWEFIETERFPCQSGTAFKYVHFL
jgi:hypothetical protein